MNKKIKDILAALGIAGGSAVLFFVCVGGISDDDPEPTPSESVCCSWEPTQPPTTWGPAPTTPAPTTPVAPTGDPGSGG